MRHRLSVLGVGTAQGAPLPDQSGGFLRNPDGEMIVSRLAASELGRLARTGGGIYLEVTADDSDLTRLNRLLDADLDADVQRLEDLASSQWREFGPWLLLPLLPLLPGPLPVFETLFAFVLFRIFDVVKPPPCRWLERLQGGVGIMADDVAAGLYAWLCVVLLT